MWVRGISPLINNYFLFVGIIVPRAKGVKLERIEVLMKGGMFKIERRDHLECVLSPQRRRGAELPQSKMQFDLCGNSGFCGKRFYSDLIIHLMA